MDYCEIITRPVFVMHLYFQLSKDEYRKSFSRSDSNNSDHSESPNSLMGSLAETPEDIGSKDVFLPFDA